MNYTCPMHPEIISDKPGKCPKCGGMDLVELKNDSNASTPTHNVQPADDYTPLMVILGLIAVVTLTLAFRDLQAHTFSLYNVITHFMAGFFVVFAGFKMLDLKGFAEGYSMYDLLAKKWHDYGYVYPFIELFFGLVMIAGFENKILLLAEIIVMGFSGVGVLIKVLKKEKFRCACLGTVLKVPLTSVTLIEDFGMAILAIILLLLTR